MEAPAKGAGMMAVEVQTKSSPNGHDTNPTRIVHWSLSPYTHGICGAKLMGMVLAESCPVCVEMAGMS